MVANAVPSPAGATAYIARAPLDESDANYQQFIKFLVVPPERQTHKDFGGNDLEKIRVLEDPVRREIYTAMHGSKEPFHFVNRKHAELNFTFRMAIIRIIHDINRGAIDFDYYNLGAGVPPSVASQAWVPGALLTWAFQARPTAKSSDAITDLLRTKTRGECNGAVTASVLGAANQVMGAAAFDALHPPGSLDLFYDGRRRHQTSARDRKTQVPGDLV
jgi:hypothetical protein